MRGTQLTLEDHSDSVSVLMNSGGIESLNLEKRNRNQGIPSLSVDNDSSSKWGFLALNDVKYRNPLGAITSPSIIHSKLQYTYKAHPNTQSLPKLSYGSYLLSEFEIKPSAQSRWVHVPAALTPATAITVAALPAV